MNRYNEFIMSSHLSSDNDMVSSTSRITTNKTQVGEVHADAYNIDEYIFVEYCIAFYYVTLFSTLLYFFLG